MKKRLLSAALALAMVLTMIPATIAPAFAAVTYGTSSVKVPSGTYKTGTAPNEVTHQFYDPTNNITQTVTQYLGAQSGEANGRIYGHWYWLDDKTNPQGVWTYYEVQTGIISTTGTSGQWYANLNDFATTNATTGAKTLRSPSFTILGNTTANEMATGTWTSTSLTVNFASAGTDGSQNVGSFTVPSNIASLTVKTVNSSNGLKGTVNGLGTMDRDGFPGVGVTAPSAVTLDATNVTIAGGINWDGRANRMTLTDCTVSGGGIDMNGTTTNDANGNQTFHGQTLTITGGTVAGNIVVYGDGSQVTLTNVNVNSNAGTLSVTGSGSAAVNIGGTTSMGAITVNSRATSAAPTVNNSIPTVTVSGGTVAGINTTGENGNGMASITVNRSSTGSTNITDAIATAKGNVSITNATVEEIKVDEGSVSLTGPVTSTGTMTLGDLAATTLSISGTGINLAGITVPSGDEENLKINGWPTTRSNYYGTLTLNKYAGKGIKGGSFDLLSGGFQPFNTADTKAWVDTTDLTYVAVSQRGAGWQASLYGKNDLAQAIADVGQSLAANGYVTLIGQTGAYDLTLRYGGAGEMAVIKYSADTEMILPTEINGKQINSWRWMDTVNDKVIKSFVAGVAETIPAGQDVTLNANDMSADVSEITSIRGATAAPVDGSNIRAEVNGTTINLSGAVPEGLGGVTTIRLTLETDAVNNAGDVITLTNVPVQFNPTTKATRFGSFWEGQNGARTEDGKLILSNGTAYTVTGSGLAVSATNLGLSKTNGFPIEVNVGGKLSSWNQKAKDDLTSLLNGGSAALTINSGNIAWAEAINAAQATITSTQTVTSWRDNARNAVWTQGFKSPTAAKNTLVNGYMIPTHSGSFANAAATNADKVTISSKFTKVYIVPYLQVNVTDYDAGNGTLEATLVPSYRVEVSADSYQFDEAYVAQQGRPLSNLTGDMGAGVTVTFNLASVTSFNSGRYLHQDGKYVYAGSTTAPAFTITHAGDTGLGSIVINDTDGQITLTQPTAADKYHGGKYDSVQAAVDDTIPAKGNPLAYSTVTIGGKFTGNCTFDMTGVARTIKVDAKGNQAVSCTSNYVDAPQIDGTMYTFQLKRNVAATTKGNITIASATGGTASVSANPATVGQTVTITLAPQAGYTSSGVTVRNASGQAVSVSGSGNTYTFVMPSGSVTVTPSFTRTQATNVLVTVSNTSTGSAVTNVGNNQVPAGTQVSVTTAPKSGYRTMGVSVTGANATRTGANTFTFYVPGNSTNVVVTPRFDVDNGTLFEDVWSYDYFSNPVQWAVKNGITNGAGSNYTFGTGRTCTREDMVTFLWRAAGSPVVSGVRNPFWDVQAGSYYYNAVMWAVSKGITQGVSSSQFGVGQTVTRGQAVTFLWRAAGSPNASTGSGFNDVSSREYYARAVSWAKSKGVTDGTSPTQFSPNSACLREQIVTFLYRDRTGLKA